MIPKITRNRCQLFTYLRRFDDGAHLFGMSRDIYPELFELARPHIARKAKSRKLNENANCWQLWFPPDALEEEDIDNIESWQDRFKRYVLIGLNHHIENHFYDELDFCLALDFNYVCPGGAHTPYGGAEYRYKYHHSLPDFSMLQEGLSKAYGDLPIPANDAVVITHVPAAPGKHNGPRELAKVIAKNLSVDYVDAMLFCDKSAMKELKIDQKIPEWERLYACPECIELDGDVEGRTVVVIDDLYQSGATMWCYAKALKKEKDAKYVLGLACVKSLRDTDNQ